MYREKLKDIVVQIEGFINDNELTPKEIGSFVYGATGVRDDYEDLIEEYPEIEALSEAGLSLEVNKSDSDVFLDYLRRDFKVLRKRYGV